MRIQTRVFLTILLSSTLLVAAMVLLMQWSINRGFVDYVNERQRADFMPMAKHFEQIYQQEGGWSRLREDPKRFHRLAARFRPRRAEMPAPPPRRERSFEENRPPLDRPQPPPPRREQRRPPAPAPVTLVDKDHRIVGGPGQRFDTATKIAIKDQDETVGWLLLPRTDRLTSGFDIRFETRQRTAFIIIGIVVIGLAALFALLLARGIVRPIRSIASAAGQLASKDYNVTVAANRRDELGELSRDINELARTLQRSDQVQKRWLADTSHELRTPVSIIRGEIEAMLDGVRPMELAQLESVKQEVLQLQKLIEDLSDLSNADMGNLRYHKEPVNLDVILADCAERFRLLCREQGLDFRYAASASSAWVYGDESRLQQLVGNLVANSCKYTDAPGEVSLSLHNDGQTAIMVLEDSAPGVPDEALPRLFDYLYRVEMSRNRETGGAGLGLAIAHRIVEAHGGEIGASHSSGGGLRIIIRLPLDRQQERG